MAGRPDHIPKTAGLVADPTIYEECFKEGQPVNRQQGHGHPVLIDMQRLECLDLQKNC